MTRFCLLIIIYFPVDVTPAGATGTPAAVVGTCAFIELKPNINSEKHPELIDKLKESTSDLNVPNASPKMFIVSCQSKL